MTRKIDKIFYLNSQEQKQEAADYILNLNSPHEMYLKKILEGDELQERLKELRAKPEEDPIR